VPNFSFESVALNQGHTIICGIDEAGRGPWAGPVVASAVILDPKNIPHGLNDSKKLNADKREFLFDPIMQSSQVGIGIVSAAEIDEINILQATFLAMQRAFAQLEKTPHLALIDGNKSPKLTCKTQSQQHLSLPKSRATASCTSMIKLIHTMVLRVTKATAPQHTPQHLPFMAHAPNTENLSSPSL
jgi:ribonuclease HII